MPLMLIVICLQLFIPWSSLLQLLAGISLKMHSYCLNWLPTNSAYWELNAALVCSHTLYETPFIKPIRTLGLLHLFVVSGFHLQLLYNFFEGSLLRSLKLKQISILSLLFIYSLCCSLKAPVLRAYLQILFATRIHSQAFRTLLVGCFILLLDPTLWNSLSLQLSWSVALFISSQMLNSFFRYLSIYICLYLFLSPLNIANPLTLIACFLLTPFIAYVFLPLSFLGLLFPFIIYLSDPLWSAFLALLNRLSHDFQLIQPVLQLSPAGKWLLLISFNLSLFYAEVWQKRNTLC